MKKGDIFIGIAILIVLAVLGLGYKLYLNSIGDVRYVNVYVDRELVYSVKLTPETDVTEKIETPYGYNIIHVYNMGVEVIEADCENQVDVRRGFVNMPGNSLICVPHHLVVVIEGESEIDGQSS